MSISIRAADETDLPLLAQMNKRLIEDEGSRNPMSVPELRHRMGGWLHGDWKVDRFVEGNITLGYAVYQFREDEYAPDKTVVYLRQMYIDRGKRSRGLGALAFKLLAQTRLPAGCTIVIDVLATNPRAAKFWSQVGFKPYCATMHLQISNQNRGESEK